MPRYFLLLFRMPGCLDFLYRLFWTCMAPGEVAGIRIEGNNKWKTIIQAAAKSIS